MKTIHDFKNTVTNFLSDSHLFTSHDERDYRYNEEEMKMKLFALQLGRWNL